MGYQNVKFPENSVFLVTGGAGFIGSHFIHYMLAKYPEYRIACLDKLTYAGNLATLQSVTCPRFMYHGEI